MLPTACAYPGCSAIVRGRYCPAHQRHVYREQDRHRRPPSRRGYGVAWAKIRARVLREEPVCACGAPTSEVDHIVPLAAGGTNARANLRALCKSHHSAKTMRTLNERRRA